MSEGQCWSVQADGSRCVEPAQPGAFFCSRHRYVRAAEASRIWRAPEGEMPRELVAALRRADPAITFPTPEPLGTEAMPATASGSAPSVSSTGGESTPVGPALSEGPPGSPELDWLMMTLRAAMEGVMAGEATPLQKANAVARLAGQYLKAYGARELRRENQTLTRRLAAAEARVAELEARMSAAELPRAATKPGEAIPLAASLELEPARERRPGSIDPRGHGWAELERGEPPAAHLVASEARSTAGAIAEGERVPP